MKLSEKAELCYMSYRIGKETEYQFCKRLRKHALLNGRSVYCFSEDGLEGVLAVDEQSKHALVVFRGTDETLDGWVDLRACPVQNLRGLGKVHKGIQESLEDAWGTILDLLTDTNVVSVSWMGHSMGGMLAELAAQWVRTDLPDLIVSDVTTFGSGPIGDSSFVDQLQSICSNVHHVVSLGDPLPFSASLWLLGYKRSGSTETVSHDGVRADIGNFRIWAYGVINSLCCLVMGQRSAHSMSEYIRRMTLGEN